MNKILSLLLAASLLTGKQQNSFPASVIASSSYGYQSAVGTPVTYTGVGNTETALYSQQLAPNLSAGVYRLTFAGIIDNVGLTTTKITVRLGSSTTPGSNTSVAATSAQTPASSGVFQGECLLTVYGAPGATAGIGGFTTIENFVASGSAATTIPYKMASTNFATNAALYLSVTVTYAGTDTGASTQLDHAVLEKIG